MENLVIDILRSKYSKSDAVGRALFYDDSKRKFYEFSALVRNLREKRADFLHITSSIDRIINDIDEYRETGNAGAHSIEANITIEQWSKDKQRVNYVVNGLLRILKSV